MVFIKFELSTERWLLFKAFTTDRHSSKVGNCWTLGVAMRDRMNCFQYVSYLERSERVRQVKASADNSLGSSIMAIKSSITDSGIDSNLTALTIDMVLRSNA
mmetsp:Transcript_15487/g.23062  ORF Transcript_15487/g.23062 Transcript_15487/m.23062 type:complete len:102 (+) Transcript_15487:1070-1375(+)